MNDWRPVCPMAPSPAGNEKPVFAYFRSPTNLKDLLARTFREIVDDNCLGMRRRRRARVFQPWRGRAVFEISPVPCRDGRGQRSIGVVRPRLGRHPSRSGVEGSVDRRYRRPGSGCGSGRVLNHLAAEYPRSTFTGIDLSEEAISEAGREAGARDLRNIEFVVADLSDFDTAAPPGAYDFVTTFDAIHDQGQPLCVLKGIRRALRSDGVYLMQDINDRATSTRTSRIR